MTVKLRLLAALMTGVAFVPTDACSATSQTLPTPSTANMLVAPTEAQPPQPEVLDADGNPFPVEIQRELEQQLKQDRPPDTRSEPAQPTSSSVAKPAPPDEGEILVKGQRPRGTVIGGISPERTFSPLEIDAYGVNNIGDLLQTLGPQVSSSSGQDDSRPVTLLNGRRVSSFAEIAEIPTEAIERMEVFPEELALQYGYRADQKVVNIVTFENFRTLLGQIGYNSSTDGGYDNASTQANYFAIRGDTRFDLGAEYNRSTSLLESDRGLTQLSEAPDDGRFRTLLPNMERSVLSGLVSGTLLGNLAFTLNGRLEVDDNKSLLGKGEVGPLEQNTDTGSMQTSTTLHGRMGKWLWTFTGNYDRVRTEVLTDVADTAKTRDRAQSTNTHGNANILLSGPVLQLPAGPISMSISGGVDLRDLNSISQQKGLDQQFQRSRDVATLQVNLIAPVTRRSAPSQSWLGNLSASTNFRIEQFSDFGTLRTLGYGVNWSPIDEASFIASVTNEQRVPTIAQLGAPLIVTPNIRTFDFARREAVDIAQIFGGNPDLLFEDQHIVRLALNIRPIAVTDFTLNVDYVSTRIDRPIIPFLFASPEIENAFPERFTRGPDGRLLQIDGRPLNFANSRQERLRWGLNFTRPFGAVDASTRNANVRVYASEADMRAAVQPGAMVAMVKPGSAMARRFENMSSRLYASFYHTWRLRDEFLISQGLAKLNLLDGAAIDPRGGTPRHELELQAGVFKKGLGARVTINWRGGTTLRDTGGSGVLKFSDLATLNVNLFANLADRFGNASAPQWLKGTRMTFSITNLLNSRPQVRDQAGSTPLRYQSAYLDPLGRLMSFTFRKVI
jgi:hypothetical protein